MRITSGFSKKFFEEDAVFEVMDNLVFDDTKLVIYFVSANYDQQKVSNGVREYLNKVAFRNDIKIVGSSTAGEIFNGDFLSDSIVAVSFSGDIKAGVGVCERVSVKGILAGSEVFERACYDMGKTSEQIKSDFRYGEKFIGISLTDGLSNVEEYIMLTLKNAAGDINIVGGSAADNLKYERTYLHVNGSTLIDASVLILMEIDMPFEVGYTINHTPTPFTMKITDANFKKRLVNEIDYTPIVNIYGKLSGKDAGELNFYDLMSNPLGVSYNNQVYLRSPIRINSNGSMSFQCFLKEGQEVIRMRQQSMVKELEELITKLERKLGNVESLLVFNCAYRYLEMLRDKTSYDIKSVFNGIDMIGMNSFGQQLNGMHMNQSLTYIAFGSR